MKKVEKAKYILIGVLISAVFGTSILPAYAASTLRRLDAYFSGIKIYIDDKAITPKDANGKTVEPFIYNGTVYLPVRAVAQALGKAVTWEGKENSVYLGKHVSTTPAANLKDLAVFLEEKLDGRSRTGWHWIGTEGAMDNVGNTYDSGVHFYDEYMNYTYGGNRVFLLNGQYSSFRGTVALAEESKSTTGSAVLKIYGDGKLLYTTPDMTQGVYPQNFDIDISGVVQLKIEAYTKTNGNVAEMILSGLDFYS